MSQQLNLPLPSRPALGRDNYFVTDANRRVLALLDDPESWPGNRLALIGPAGSGKTHLAHVFATAMGAKVIDGPDTSIYAVDEITNGPLVIDNADACDDEQALFHIYNLMNERGHSLMFTSLAAPARWSIRLPDLKSRMNSVAVAEVGAPDDALLTAVIAKNFSDRGIAPPANLIPYLVPRIERSLAAAIRVVDQIDNLSMTERRPIGTRLAARVLDKLDDNSA